MDFKMLVIANNNNIENNVLIKAKFIMNKICIRPMHSFFTVMINNNIYTQCVHLIN